MTKIWCLFVLCVAITDIGWAARPLVEHDRTMVHEGAALAYDTTEAWKLFLESLKTKSCV